MNTDDMRYFFSYAPLTYDPAEIEHRLYMFDHRCVGCVMLNCTNEVDTDVVGSATLDERPLDDLFYYHLYIPGVADMMALVVPVRGLIDYGQRCELKLRDFQTKDGSIIAEHSFFVTGTARPAVDPRYAEHDEVALNAAREGMVLLKNEGALLPLKSGTVLNLFGDGVTNFRISATGAGRINPRYAMNLREAIRDCTDFRLNPELDELYALPRNVVPGEEVLKRAKAMEDTGIVIITRGTGENVDNRPIEGEYYLTQNEQEILRRVSETFSKTLVVLNTGYPIDMRWLKELPVDAVIYTGLAGQGAAQALCEILSGKVVPSGHLPDTWAWDYRDIPASVNFYEGEPILADDNIWAETAYEEGIYVGYRYFETFQKNVAFPFGHGLSYTSFEVSAESVRNEADSTQVTVLVTNTGAACGKEVVQLYARLPGSLQEQPVRKLVAVAKTKLLAPGETERLELSVDLSELTTYLEEENAWVLEPGTTAFYLGENVRDAVRIGERDQAEKEVFQKLCYSLPTPIAMETLSQKGKQWPTGEQSSVLGAQDGLRYAVPVQIQLPPDTERQQLARTITYGELKLHPELLNAFVAQMDTEELARFTVMFNHGWSMDSKGEAGRLAPMEKYGIPDYICADGNCGVNLTTPNIGMPTSVVLCSSFNRELAFEVGRVIGEEAKENDIQMILATAMNIHRNPLNGRHAEYFSEDPYLAGMMAVGQVRGLHSVGVSDSIKHVACNNCETARKRNHSFVDQRALRELYLKPYELLIRQEMPDTIMTGYNALNGSFCGESEVLIEKIFREEFGFDGFAMTDWNSYDTVDKIAAVNAGISWLTPGESDGSIVQEIMDGVNSKRTNRAVLERNIRRVFQIMLRRGI